MSLRPPPSLLRVIAPLVTTTLRSRAHPILSRRFALLTYRGRRSGAEYTIPIGYRRWGEREVVAFASGRWPVNLRDGRPVRLLVRGRRRTASPLVEADRAAKVELLDEFLRRYGVRGTRLAFLGLPLWRRPTRADLVRAASGVWMIRFRFLD